MNINDFKTSKFLKQTDVGDGMIVTITKITTENVAQEGADPEMKHCIHFKEIDKPLVCNSTNAQLIAMSTGINDNIEAGWIGKQIELWNDPSVSFGGKLTGGIRVRITGKPKQAPEESPIPS